MKQSKNTCHFKAEHMFNDMTERKQNKQTKRKETDGLSRKRDMRGMKQKAPLQNGAHAEKNSAYAEKPTNTRGAFNKVCFRAAMAEGTESRLAYPLGEQGTTKLADVIARDHGGVGWDT